ncbi:MAG: helix-turn-helix domain-containing protein [Actinomycetota bacterium]|nr:helix-turn-helix domain-containing protein [Actinomycetota bacterium]
MSQHEFARAVGFAKRTVGNAERGTHPPSLALRRALDHALDRASDAQRGRFLAAMAADHPATPVVDSATPTIESVELLRRTEASHLGPGTLDQLEELVERLGVEYFAVPPTEFREKVLSWRRYVAGLLEGRLTLRERRHLYAVVGWLSGLLAEASLALGDEAEPHCVTALSLAQEAGHAGLAGWIRSTQAQIALYAGDPREAVTVARAGRQVAPMGSAAMFRACVVEARAHGRSGDLEETERAFSKADEVLEARLEPRTGSFFSFDAPYLPYYAGTAYLWLGKAAVARTWASQAIELCDADPLAWPVARTSARVDNAVALAQAGELDGAVAIGTEALDIWGRRPTHPARRRIEELLAALRQFPEPCVTELNERWRWISGAS